MLRKIIYTILALVLGQSGNSQTSGGTKNDSLFNRDFEYLENKIFEFSEQKQDTINANKFAAIYLKKAKHYSNPSNTLKGFYFLTLINDYSKSIMYCDSAIDYAKSVKIENKLGGVYIKKGNLLFGNGEYESAVDNYLMAKDNIDKSKKPLMYDIVVANIGSVKSIIGKHDEALEIFREIVQKRLPKNPATYEIDNRLENIFGLAHSFRKLSNLDSATFYNKQGSIIAKEYNRQALYGRFSLNEATNLYDKKDYVSAIDSVNLAIPILAKAEDSTNLAIAYLYKGKLLSLKFRDEQAIVFFKKAEKIVTTNKLIHPYFTELFERLYQHSKEHAQSEQQLVYLEKLIDFNHRLSQRYRYVDNVLEKLYDIPELLKEKESLIIALKSQNKAISFRSTILLVSLIFMFFISLHYYTNRLRDKKRYEKLLQKEVSSKKIAQLHTKPKLKIPSEIVKKTLQNLSDFEKNKGFLDNSLSLGHLAKEMDTNSNYLSKIINYYKDKNFSNYIADLRIDSIIIELRENSKIQNYTIKAIAQESGFGNAESFTKAFYRKTGIYPSYFLKKLKKEQTIKINPNS